MDNNLIEKYKREMLEMYRASSAAVPAVSTAAIPAEQEKNAQSENIKNSNTEKSGFSSQEEMRKFMGESDTVSDTESSVNKSKNTSQSLPIMPRVASKEDIGYLVANVTSLKGLYPVANAKVTIFTGPYNAMDVVATHITNSSGKTKPFDLYAPPIVNSLRPNSGGPAYAEYNMLVQADGYVDNIHLKIPIFKGVTSIQPSNLVLVESSKPNVGPNVFDSSAKYDL